jgi:uncharacterized protein
MLQRDDHSPFLFGKLPVLDDFINREKELKRLSINCEAGINTILISPRRWGKSFLLRKLASQYQNSKQVKFCFIDLFQVRTEEDFYKAFSAGVIKGTSGKAAEWLDTAYKWLKSVSPKLSIPTSDTASIDLELEFTNPEKQKNIILDLPERIAKEKKIRVVVCIDEFQNIELFEDPTGFQKILRASWQHQQNTAYCLYGSRRSMMSQLFQSRNMPFYKFGDVIYLNKIEETPLVNFIIDRFKKTKKKITKTFAEKIVREMQCHSYYVQQLAHFVWMYSGKEVTEESYKLACEELLDVNRNLFRREFETLSAGQINLLRAMNAGNFTNLTTGVLIKKFNLNSSSNVVRTLEALEKKDFIDRFTGEIEFVDPVFQMWMKEVF